MAFQDAVAALKAVAASDAKYKRDQDNAELLQTVANQYTKAINVLQAAIDSPKLQDKIKEALSKKLPQAQKRLDELLPVGNDMGIKVTEVTAADCGHEAGAGSAPGVTRVPPKHHAVDLDNDYFKLSVAALKRATAADSVFHKSNDASELANVVRNFAIVEELLLCTTVDYRIAPKIKAALAPKLDSVQKRLQQLEPKLSEAHRASLEKEANDRREEFATKVGQPPATLAPKSAASNQEPSPASPAPSSVSFATSPKPQNAPSNPPSTPPNGQADATRYCKKCKVAFATVKCPGSHANFLYTKIIPGGVALPASADTDAGPSAEDTAVAEQELVVAKEEVACAEAARVAEEKAAAAAAAAAEEEAVAAAAASEAKTARETAQAEAEAKRALSEAVAAAAKTAEARVAEEEAAAAKKAEEVVAVVAAASGADAARAAEASAGTEEVALTEAVTAAKTIEEQVAVDANAAVELAKTEAVLTAKAKQASAIERFESRRRSGKRRRCPRKTSLRL
jgi:hypothetical protein